LSSSLNLILIVVSEQISCKRVRVGNGYGYFLLVNENGYLIGFKINDMFLEV